MSDAAPALLKDILDLHVPAGLSLSPDGRSVAWVARLKWNQHNKGQHRSGSLWIADTDRPKSARPLTDGSYNDRAPRWSPDGRSVAFLSDRGGRGRSYAVYTINGIGGGEVEEPKAVTPPEKQGRILKFAFSPDGRKIAFIATPEKSEEQAARERAGDDASVWGRDWVCDGLSIVRLEKGEEGAGSVVRTAGNGHVVDFAWKEDGAQIAFAALRTPHAESVYLDGTTVSVLDTASGRINKICHVPGFVSGLTWVGAALYYVGSNVPDKDTSGFAVYSVDMTQVAPDGHFMYKRVAYGINSCAKHIAKVDGSSRLLIHGEKGMEDELRFLDGSDPVIRQKRRIAEFSTVSPADGGEIKLVISQGDLNNPTEVFSVSQSGDALQLSDHGAIFKAKHPSPFGSVGFIACDTLDGKERLEGLFLTPGGEELGEDGSPRRALPTAVIIHGGPYCRVTDAFDFIDPFHILIPGLLAQGHGVLVPNYRGSSGRGERFASYARGGVGTSDEPDVVAMTKRAVELGWADGARLAALGWSQGGHLAFLSSVRNGAHGLGWRFRAVVAGAGVADWDSLTVGSDIGYAQAETAGGAPWGLDKEDRRTRAGSAIWEFAAAARARRIPPMLILHGERDERVPVAQAWAFRRALDEARLPFELVTYPREGHFFAERKHIEDLTERTLRFVGAHLGG